MFSIQTAYLSMIFVIVSCNYLVQFPINDWLTWGSFTYPITFLITELNNCFFGPKVARRVVYIGFLLACLLSLLVSTTKIALASGLAFLISQLFDIYVFSMLRRSLWWFAPLLASVLASFIDTGIFWSLAFWGEPVPFIKWITSDFLIKLLCDFLMLIPFRAALRKMYSPPVTE